VTEAPGNNGNCPRNGQDHHWVGIWAPNTKAMTPKSRSIDVDPWPGGGYSTSANIVWASKDYKPSGFGP
jgi:hypothetical protein